MLELYSKCLYICRSCTINDNKCLYIEIFKHFTRESNMCMLHTLILMGSNSRINSRRCFGARCLAESARMKFPNPRCSMYGKIYSTYIWFIFMVNVGKYTLVIVSILRYSNSSCLCFILRSSWTQCQSVSQSVNNSWLVNMFHLTVLRGPSVS